MVSIVYSFMQIRCAYASTSNAYSTDSTKTVAATNKKATSTARSVSTPSNSCSYDHEGNALDGYATSDNREKEVITALSPANSRLCSQKDVERNGNSNLTSEEMEFFTRSTMTARESNFYSPTDDAGIVNKEREAKDLFEMDRETVDGGLANYTSVALMTIDFSSSLLLKTASLIVAVSRVRLGKMGNRKPAATLLGMWKADIKFIENPLDRLKFSLARIPDSVRISVRKGWVNRRMNLMKMARRLGIVERTKFGCSSDCNSDV